MAEICFKVMMITWLISTKHLPHRPEPLKKKICSQALNYALVFTTAEPAQHRDSGSFAVKNWENNAQGGVFIKNWETLGEKQKTLGQSKNEPYNSNVPRMVLKIKTQGKLTGKEDHKLQDDAYSGSKDDSISLCWNKG